MPYFPVDDQFAFHPKAIMAGNAAVGLWTRAGSWSKAHAEGGRVPHEIAHALGTKREIDRLVKAGLWISLKGGGYQFHDWDHQAGNFDAETEKSRREKDRERWRKAKREQRERERSQENDDSHRGSHADVNTGITAPPSPVPSPSPKTRVNNVSHLPNGAAEIDIDKVIIAVQKHCGRDCGTTGAYLIIGTVMDRAKQTPKNKTAFIVKAIERDPFEFQKILDEAVA